MSSPPAPLERPVGGPGEAVGPRVRRPRLPPAPALAGTLPQPNALLTAGIGLLVAALAIGGGGTSSLRSATIAHMAMVLAGGVLVGGAGLIAARPRRLWGVWSLVGLVVLAALTAASIAWSINPADSWLEANRTFAYAAVFAAAVACAHVAPHRWQALLGGLLLGSVLACVYALATKVLPGLLAENEIYARLRQPFGYWNAVGLMAALGLPGCLWLGSRRHGHAGINALAYPAAGVLLLTLLLSYSRGALLAAAVGCALWFAFVPRRLRGFAVLSTGLVVAFAAALWAFGQAALTQDEVELALRAAAGAQLGLLAAAVALTLLVAGLALGFTTALRPPPPITRRRAGAIALVAVALVPVGVTVALATSERGLGGSIAAAWDSVTAPEVANPTNGPSRLTDPQSVRGLYWRESLQMFSDNPVAGLGAGGFETARPRYGPDPITTSYAHGFGFQTLADLGLAGGLVVAGLLAAWAAAALRASGLSRGWRRRAHTPERMGLITLLAVAAVFGVHSLIDWTWVFPATAGAALLCAGWLAGRGPFDETPRARAERRVGRLRARLVEGLRSPARAAAAGGVLALTLVAAWTVWQPLRAQGAGEEALAALADGDRARAQRLAARAAEINPVALEPLFAQATIQRTGGDPEAGQRALLEAVRLQPENHDAWLRLAEYQLTALRRPELAAETVRTAIFLDPRSPQAVRLFLEARRAMAAG